MALVLVKEDGTGKPDANTYALVADAEAYYDGHLYGAAWSSASPGNKEKALAMATRLIDSYYQFNGWKTNEGQALQWPRERCPDPDKGVPTSVLFFTSGPYLDSTIVPKAVIDATCELCRHVLNGDPTGTWIGDGLLSSRNGQTDAAAAGASGDSSYTSYVFDKKDVPPTISKPAQAMLAKYGTLLQNGGAVVRLLRS